MQYSYLPPIRAVEHGHARNIEFFSSWRPLWSGHPKIRRRRSATARATGEALTGTWGEKRLAIARNIAGRKSPVLDLTHVRHGLSPNHEVSFVRQLCKQRACKFYGSLSSSRHARFGHTPLPGDKVSQRKGKRRSHSPMPPRATGTRSMLQQSIIDASVYVRFFTR